MDFPIFKRIEDLDPAKLRRPGGRPASEDMLPDIMSVLADTPAEWTPQPDLVAKMTEQGQSATSVKRQIQKAVKDGTIIREKANGRSYRLKKNDQIVIKF